MKHALIAASALVLGLLALGPAAAQGPATGRLLVASPDMEDSNFAKTVVLLLHHDPNGTLGVIINRPTWVKPGDIDPDLGSLETYEGSVFRGGPVAASQLVYLVRDPPAGTFQTPAIFDNVYAGGNPDQLTELTKTAPDDERLRLYAGHAEWAAGQLEREIEAGHWVLVESTPDRVFTENPATLWNRIFHKGSELTVDARPATAPEGPEDVSPLPPPQPFAVASSDPH
jgi:putative transcriptional regulator